MSVFEKVVLIVVFVSMSLISGCSSKELATAEENGDKFFYDCSSGEVITDLSINFHFKLQNWKLYFDPEISQERILFTIAIKNKTETRINNFNCTVKFNEEATPLFASGITVYNNNKPQDLIPKYSANGVSYSYDLLIEKDELFTNIKADKDVLLDKAREVQLLLTWNGGEETINIICDEISR